FEHLSEIEQINLPSRSKEIKPVYHVFQIQCERRDELISHLESNGVQSLIHYPIPISEQPAFKKVCDKKFKLAECDRLAQNSLSLPIFPGITEDEIEMVVSTIKNFYS
ncbi:MAG: transcriptional regulator, partial [Bacteroidia bacterium]|nr:transcriptional regulator [Bacteroidia bacterium]